MRQASHCGRRGRRVPYCEPSRRSRPAIRSSWKSPIPKGRRIPRIVLDVAPVSGPAVMPESAIEDPRAHGSHELSPSTAERATPVRDRKPRSPAWATAGKPAARASRRKRSGQSAGRRGDAASPFRREDDLPGLRKSELALWRPAPQGARITMSALPISTITEINRSPIDPPVQQEIPLSWASKRRSLLALESQVHGGAIAVWLRAFCPPVCESSRSVTACQVMSCRDLRLQSCYTVFARPWNL